MQFLRRESREATGQSGESAMCSSVLGSVRSRSFTDHHRSVALRHKQGRRDEGPMARSPSRCVYPALRGFRSLLDYIHSLCWLRSLCWFKYISSAALDTITNSNVSICLLVSACFPCECNGRIGDNGPLCLRGGEVV